MTESQENLCPGCGARNERDAQVCSSCGASMGTKITRPATEPLPTQPIPKGRRVDPKPGDAPQGPPPEEEEPSILSGRYRLIYKIARGGMGVIYLAEDALLDNMRVAIKILPQQLSPELQAERRLKREALTAMTLSHDNIVRLFAFDQHEGQQYMVMEYVNGPTLMDFVEQRGAISPAEVVSYIVAVCEGLQYAHDKNFVHRDIKPANIMLTLPQNSPFVPPLAPRGSKPEPEPNETAFETGALPRLPRRKSPLSRMTFEDTREGQIKVCDFGIARRLNAEQTRLTGESVIGSPVYMSPEQYRGEELDHRSDVYSLSVTAYEMLAGSPPFEGPIHSLTYQILDKPARPIEGLSMEMNRVLLKALEKHRENRWQSCREFARALSRALGEEKAPDVAVGAAAAQTAPTSTQSGEMVSDTASDNFASQTQIARISFEAKLYDRALQELRDMHASHGPKPELLEMAHECATQLVKKKKYDEAKMYCNYALQIEPRSPETLHTLGILERQRGHLDEAERNLRLALKYGGDSNVEKELRTVLTSSVREKSRPGGGLAEQVAGVTRMSPAMLTGFLLTALVCGGIAFAVGMFVFGRLGGDTPGAVVAGLALLILCAFGSSAASAAFTGPLSEFKDRFQRIRHYSTAQGYAGGWLMLGGGSAAIWLLYKMVFGTMRIQDTEFVLIFGIPCWLMSVVYSWIIATRALKNPSPFD